MVWPWSDSYKSVAKSDALIQFEQQIAMMEMVFMKSVELCTSKCMPPLGESIFSNNAVTPIALNKAEAVCLQRCANKFFEALELVSNHLASVGRDQQQAISSPQQQARTDKTQ